MLEFWFACAQVQGARGVQRFMSPLSNRMNLPVNQSTPEPEHRNLSTEAPEQPENGINTITNKYLDRLRAAIIGFHEMRWGHAGVTPRQISGVVFASQA